MIYADPAFAEWRDYILAPARAALSALHVLADESVDIYNAVEEICLDDDLVAQIAKSESREKFYELTSCLEDGVVVQYLGSAPPGCEVAEIFEIVCGCRRKIAGYQNR